MKRAMITGDRDHGKITIMGGKSRSSPKIREREIRAVGEREKREIKETNGIIKHAGQDYSTRVFK